MPPTNWHPCFSGQQPAALQVIPRWEGHNDARPRRLLRPIPRSLNVSYVGPPSKIPTGGGPTAELDELAAIYEAKGVSSQTAAQVAAELTAHDALAADVDVELRLDPDDLANPQRAAASAASFTVGTL